MQPERAHTANERRLFSLDLVRGIAALAVAIPHYLILGPGASATAEIVSVLAVEVFFVLSGYVLAAQIVHCASSRAWESLGVFLMRRWMRTIPPYLFALLVLSVIAGQTFGADFFRYCFYVQNLFFQANSQDYYPIAWSLSVEEWFYVTFPVMTFVCLRWAARADLRGCVWIALGFVTSIALVRGVFGDSADWGADVRRVVVFRLDSIAYGFLLYAATTRHLPLERLAAFNRWTLAALLLTATTAAAAFDCVAAIAIGPNPLREQLFPFCAAAFGSAVIFLFYTLAALVERLPLLPRLATYVGRISYSVYLFHIVVAQLLQPQLVELALLQQLAIYIAGVVLFCTLFYAYFERPVLAARPQYRAPAASPEQAETSPPAAGPRACARLDPL